MANRDQNRRYEITAFGEHDTLQMAVGTLPDAAGDVVRVRVRYAGLNFADVMQRRGLYPGIQDLGLPFTPGIKLKPAHSCRTADQSCEPPPVSSSQGHWCRVGAGRFA